MNKSTMACARPPYRGPSRACSKICSQSTLPFPISHSLPASHIYCLFVIPVHTTFLSRLSLSFLLFSLTYVPYIQYNTYWVLFGEVKMFSIL